MDHTYYSKPATVSFVNGAEKGGGKEEKKKGTLWVLHYPHGLFYSPTSSFFPPFYSSLSRSPAIPL